MKRFYSILILSLLCVVGNNVWAAAGPGSREIWYTSSDGQKITDCGFSGAYVHVYDSNSGVWVAKFDNDVTSISDNAFSQCASLKSITLPESVTSIGKEAFAVCTSLVSINIPSNVSTIGNSTFSNCSSLTSITLPEGVTSIEEYAFYKCSSLASINIPANVTSIGIYAFQDCTSFPVENNLRYADTYLVGAADKTLSSYTIKDGTKWIGADAFIECKNLTSITIPSSVIDIQIKAFSHCSSLTSITIPASVAKLGKWAFVYCTSLETVICEGDTPPSLGQAPFDDCSSLTSIVVPYKAESNYKSIWGEYAGKIKPYISLQEALDGIDSAVSAAKSAIDGYSQLSDAEKADSKTQIDAAASGAKPIIEAATMTTIFDAYQNGLKGIQNIHCNAAIAELRKIVACSFVNYGDMDLSSYETAIKNTTTADETETELSNAKAAIAAMPATTWGDKKYFISRENDSYELKISDMVFADKDFYWSNVDFTLMGNLIYRRTVNDGTTDVTGKWQAWFVPFDVQLTSSELDKFDAAQVAGVLADNDGQPLIAFKKMKEGEIMKGNIPYVIRPKNENINEIEFVLMTPEFHSSATTPFVIQSAYDNFTLGGTYQAAQNSEWYALSKDGAFKKMNGSPVPTLQPQRIWMTVTPREDAPYATNSVSARSGSTKSSSTPDTIRIVVLDYDGKPEGKPIRKAQIINADGQSVNRVQRGQVYRVNANIVE